MGVDYHMALKIVIFLLKIYIWVLNLAKIINMGQKYHPYRIIRMGHVSEASVAHYYQKIAYVSCSHMYAYMYKTKTISYFCCLYQSGKM